MEIGKGERYAGRFTILAKVRAGGTASLYKAYDDELSTLVALKIFTIEGRDPDVVSELSHRESTALSTLSHDAIVKFHCAGRDTDSVQRYLVLEWIDGTTLEDHFDKSGALTWDAFYEAIGKPVLAALVHAADKNVTHRDLTPGNIMVAPNGAIKVIDFGQAKVSSNSIGRTVAGWRTTPYCPPEEDTGTYTYTRDPFSFCAIAVRALVGHVLPNHESLYSAFESTQVTDHIRSILARALHRDPRERYQNIIDFNSALESPNPDNLTAECIDLPIPIRLTAAIVDRVIFPPESSEDTRLTATDLVIEELNDTVALSSSEHNSQTAGTRIELETQSYRLIADIDGTHSDHLVIVSLVQKRFRLDSLYQTDRWIPQARFTATLPQLSGERTAARSAIRSMYQALEEFQTSLTKAHRREGRAITEWARLLDALRHLAKHGVPPLRYTNLEHDGNRLIATIDNPEDAREEELRTISVEGRWVFRGEVESIRGNTCVLVSTRRRIDLESIPTKGDLELDWQQEKVALDRQARAVERFKTATLPNPQLGRLLTGEDSGPSEPTFAHIDSFFDGKLDTPKKEIVSRCMAGIDLLVTHGPPGTGKTKVIVELIRQSLKSDANCKILMVSQTHVALDNALERLLEANPEVSCVRIGSGSAESDPRVAKCTIDQRGKVLRHQVETASREFLGERAKSLGVDQSLVELGLRAIDVVALRDVLKTQRQQITDLDSELDGISEKLNERDGKSQSTSERSDRHLRSTVIEQDMDWVQSQMQITEAELASAVERLGLLSKTGRELAQAGESDLQDWADMLIEDDGQREIGGLMKLAEEWRLRFGQSDDFKAAIISSSSIVAGTCVGFCREEAASRTTFDLCIIDEAGKATTTELLVPLAQSRRAVIVGDHHQLPAVVDYAIRAPDLIERFGLSARQLDVQLFEELTNELGAGGRAALDVQYRMRGSIGSLISACFYKSALKADESLDSRRIPDLTLACLTKPVTWIDPYVGVGKDRFEQRNGTSYSSGREIQCIVAILKRLNFIFDKTHANQPWPSIGVITGYGPQASALRSEIRKDPSLDRMNVECATVHAFQGREVDICIYSVVRRNHEYRIGMLKDWRHLNVALSRSRNFLVIVGGLEFCRSVPAPNPFSSIIDYIESSEDCDVREWSDD